MERYTIRCFSKPLGWRQVKMLQSLHLAESPMSLASLRKAYGHQKRMAAIVFDAGVASALVMKSLINRQFVDGDKVYALTPLGKDVAIETLAGR